MSDPKGYFEVVVAFLDPMDEVLLGASLASLRLYAAFALLPPFGQRFLSGFLRQGVIGILALYIGMGVPLDAINHLGPLQICAHAAKETMIGLMIGFAGSKVFWIAQSVGVLIDTQAGFNNVQVTNPMSGQQSTPVSELLLHVVVVTFFAMGGMIVLMGAIFDSFHVWPVVSAMPEWSRVPELFVVDQTQSLMAAIVKFASPMLLVLVLIDTGFGLVTRVAPKLELSALSQPVKGAVTVLMLAILIGTLVSQIRGLLLPTALLAQLQAVLGSSH